MSFGYSHSFKDRVQKCTPQLLYQALDSEGTAKVCAEIADALESVKRGEMSREDFEEYKNNRKKELPVLTPHATFLFGRRKNEGATPSGLSMYDVDHISLTPNPSPKGEGSIYQRLVNHTLAKEPITDEGMIAELKRLGICLVHVTPSTEGFRLFFVMPEGMNLATAQKWMSEQLGDAEYDGSVKDLARASFLVPRDYLLYIDEEELFKDREYKMVEDAEIVEEKTNPRKDEGGGSKENQRSAPMGKANTPEIQTPVFPDQFKGVPYSSIISEYWNRTGGEPIRGERNKRLHQLAANLRAICENSENWLLEVMPTFGLSVQEMRTIIHSACKEPTKGSRMMDQIVSSLKGGTLSEDIDEDEDKVQCSKFNVQSSKLPIGLKESLVGVPPNMHLPVLCSVLPIAGAYADQVEVEYCDGNTQHLGIMSIILGEQASGKSVCKHVVDVWKRQFEEEDALARKREEEWKERKKSRKANEKAPDDPHVLIRMMPVTVSCSTLLKRFKNANGHTLYSFGEELDTLRKTNGAGSWSSKYDIYRLSFDRGEWGQDYNSDQAESGVVNVAYNWTILGTYGAMRKCFKADNIENGLSSRILVAEMPDNSFSQMPKFGKRSKDDESKIQEAVTKLRSYSGLVDTPKLRKSIEAWVEEKRVEAAKDIDHVKDTYRKRAAVIGFRAGVIFHLLTGKDKETKDATDFALQIAEYCLEQQIKTFGETLLNQYVVAESECVRYSENHTVFDQLPPTFSMEDLRSLKSGNYGKSTLRTIVLRWKKDGWILKVGPHHWQKCRNVACHTSH